MITSRQTVRFNKEKNWNWYVECQKWEDEQTMRFRMTHTYEDADGEIQYYERTRDFSNPLDDHTKHPDWRDPHENLIMHPSVSELLNKLANGKNSVTLDVIAYGWVGNAYTHYKMVDVTKDGAEYELRYRIDLPQRIFLTPMAKYILGIYPEHLHGKLVSVENIDRPTKKEEKGLVQPVESNVGHNTQETNQGVNFEVMTHTLKLCENAVILKEAIASSISKQVMINEEDNFDFSPTQGETKIEVSLNRTFAAAHRYTGSKVPEQKRVTVLNFANNYMVGGNPFYSGAQEESLCRCSTLYPCLKAMSRDFYGKHQEAYEKGKLNRMGNDDMIFTPDVVVFKTDVRPRPSILEDPDWYKVNVITAAAPELNLGQKLPDDYERVMECRIKRVLDIAAKNDTEVLILGAWGCGAFNNPPKVIASLFHKLLKNYNFEKVEFAIGGAGENFNAFRDEFEV